MKKYFFFFPELNFLHFRLLCFCQERRYYFFPLSNRNIRGILSFSVLTSHCLIYSYLYFKMRQSIYRKVEILFFFLLEVAPLESGFFSISVFFFSINYQLKKFTIVVGLNLGLYNFFFKF